MLSYLPHLRHQFVSRQSRVYLPRVFELGSACHSGSQTLLHFELRAVTSKIYLLKSSPCPILTQPKIKGSSYDQLKTDNVNVFIIGRLKATQQVRTEIAEKDESEIPLRLVRRQCGTQGI